MKFFFILLLTTMYIAACSQNLKDEKGNTVNKTVKSDTIVEIKYQKKFVYKTNSTNADSLGFYYSGENPALSIYNIVICDSSLFFSDACFDNIKKLDIKTGVFSCSKSYSNYRGLCEIALMGNKIFSFFFSGDVVVFDLDLNPLFEFKINDFVGFSNVLSVSDSSISVFRQTVDVHQNQKKWFIVNYYKVSQNYSVIADSVTYKEYPVFSSKVERSIQGKEFDIIQNNQSVLLSNEYGRFDINRDIPSTSMYYDSKNLYFTKNQISFFEISNDSIFIYYYSY